MHWNVATSATGNENDHSHESIYAYLWGLCSNAELPFRYKAFHCEGKCETFMVKTTPVTCGSYCIPIHAKIAQLLVNKTLTRLLGESKTQLSAKTIKIS